MISPNMEKLPIKDIKIAYARLGGGPPLLLLHGYPLDHSLWDAVIGLLKDDYDLIVPDLRGFGNSSKLETDYTMLDMAEDISGLFAQLGIEKAIVAGHSMGGYVALAFADKYPERVAGLCIISSQELGDNEEQKRTRYATAEQVEKSGVEVVLNAIASKLSPQPEVRAIASKIIMNQSPAGVIGALKAMAVRDDTSAVLGSADFPVLIVHGNADQLIPFERAKQMKEKCPDSILHTINGAGHLPMLDDPEEVALALKVFRKRIVNI